MAGLSEVPVVILEADDKKAAEYALIENIQREDLNPIEEARGYRSLIEDFDLTQEQAAKQVGKSRAAVTNSLRLLDLPEDVLDLVANKALSAGHARTLLGLSDKSRISEVADTVILRELSVRATEELVKKLSSAEKINKSCATVNKAILGSDKIRGASYLIEAAANALDAISDSVVGAAELSARLNNVKYEIEDVAECARELADVGEGDPTQRLDKAQARLAAIARLKRKYGGTVGEILEFRADAAKRLDGIEHADDRAAELGDELAKKEGEARAIALTLRERRRAAAQRLQKSVGETLAFLDMPKVRFDVAMTDAGDFTPFGRDTVEFVISTNPGEPMMPMAKIASGGELARIMLSLKNVLNRSDGVDTVIFDEIDTGISGKTSRKVGIKLKEIGRESQVICVTHSAQIASLAHNHLYIAKREVDGRSETTLCALDHEGRVAEIARILGGIEITEAQRTAAKEMIAEGEEYQ